MPHDDLKILVDSEVLSLGFFSPVGSGESNDAANVGGGAGVYRDKVGATINLRSLVGADGVTVTQNADEIEISTAGTAGDVVGPAGATDEAIAVFDGTTGKLIKESGASADVAGNVSTPGSVSAASASTTGGLSVGTNITVGGTVDGRDVAVDGAAQDSHIADTANPHSTDLGNIGSGTLAELNAAITDANLDDDGDPRTPTAHATTHQNGGSDEINVGGLSGLLADDQSPLPHAATHEDGGSDELQVEDLATAGALGTIPRADGTGGLTMEPISALDQLVRVTSADIASGYLNGKVVAGNALSSSVLNPGGDEDLQLDVVEGDIDHQNITNVGTNTHPQIDSHIANTANPHATDVGNLGSGTLAELNAAITDATLDDTSGARTPTAHASTHSDGGSDEITVENLGTAGGAGTVPTSDGAGGLTMATPTPSLDETVKVSAADTTKDYLSNKIVAGNALTSTILNPAGDEDLQLNVDETAIDHTNLLNKGTNTHAQIDTHIADTANPHSTDVGNLGSGTLAELNAAITDATLDDSSSPRTPIAHGATHAQGGSDAVAVEALGTAGAAGTVPTSDGVGGLGMAAVVTAVTAPADVDKSAAAIGSDPLAARADHKHDVSTAVASGLDSSSTSAEGSATSLARSDHTHEISETGTVSDLQPDDTAADGSAAGFARKDHVHGIAADTAVEITDSTNAEGSSTSFARADHTHAHGNRGGGSLHAITSLSGGAGFQPKCNFSGTAVPSATNDITEGYEVGSLWVNVVGDDTYVCVDNTNSAAIWNVIDSTAVAAHAFTHSDGGSDEITVENLATAGALGTVPASDGAGGLTMLAVATVTATPPLDVDKSAAQVGTGSQAARDDHKHDISTAAASGLDATSTSTEGSATSLARSDHTHEIAETGTVTTIQPDVSPSDGTAAGFARKDHRHGVTADAAGAIQVGDTAAEGSSTSFARADHVHSLAAPAAPADVTRAAASAGTSSSAARADHKHDISTATPGTIQPDATALEGTATSLARSDHTHAIVAAAPSQGIGGGNLEGTSTSFARADHNHTIRETGGPTNLTVGSIADPLFVKRTGSALVGAVPVLNFASAIAETRTTTTGENTVKTTLTTPAITGTLIFFWQITLDSNNKETVGDLYNSTDAVLLDQQIFKTGDPDFRWIANGYVTLALTGSAKTIQLRFGNTVGNTDIIGGQRARIYHWRVA